jgi:hypothetical protein
MAFTLAISAYDWSSVNHIFNCAIIDVMSPRAVVMVECNHNYFSERLRDS